MGPACRFCTSNQALRDKSGPERPFAALFLKLYRTNLPHCHSAENNPTPLAELWPGVLDEAVGELRTTYRCLQLLYLKPGPQGQIWPWMAFHSLIFEIV